MNTSINLCESCHKQLCKEHQKDIGIRWVYSSPTNPCDRCDNLAVYLAERPNASPPETWSEVIKATIIDDKWRHINNQWRHIAVAYPGNGKPTTIYVDGEILPDEPIEINRPAV